MFSMDALGALYSKYVFRPLPVFTYIVVLGVCPPSSVRFRTAVSSVHSLFRPVPETVCPGPVRDVRMRTNNYL